MPTSDYHHISDVLHVVHQCNPETILEIGIGFGKWGVLCREILDVYGEQLTRQSWTRRIDGIEVYEPYRNDLWSFAYDHVHIGNALTVIDSIGHYDLILCCDVIEHFSKEDGHRLLAKALARSDIVILTSPRGPAPQGAVHGNDFERHRSVWTRDDFLGFPHLYKDVGFTFMAVLGRSDQQLRAIKVMHPLGVLGVKRGAKELVRLAMCRMRMKLTSTSHDYKRSDHVL